MTEANEEQSEVQMYVAGLVLDPASNAPIVLLKDTAGEVCLPIWIGLAEATAIASALKKMDLARPMTHDLLKNVIDELGGRVLKIAITTLEENTFFATIDVVVGDVMKVIDSRPSDAIALAVRVDAPIMVNADVLAQAQVAVENAEPVAAGSEEAGAGDQRSRETGEHVFSNIDKDKWAEILSEMDPEDFKYKM